jgi:hypothetical protein
MEYIEVILQRNSNNTATYKTIHASAKSNESNVAQTAESSLKHMLSCYESKEDKVVPADKVKCNSIIDALATELSEMVLQGNSRNAVRNKTICTSAKSIDLNTA